MAFYSYVALVVAIVLGQLSAQAAGTAFQAGGTDSVWTYGGTYPPISANVGDTVYFFFSSGHNVYQFPSFTAYNNCDFTAAMSLSTAGPFTVTITSLPAYYGCQIGSHCSTGNMKLAVTQAPAQITVAWAFYLSTSASGVITANVGDTLTFAWTGVHNVNVFANEAAYANCNFTGSTSVSATTGATYTIVSLPVYFGCEVSGHCTSGMKLAVNPNGNSTSNNHINGAFGVADIASSGYYLIIASMLGQLLLCII